MRSGPGRWWQRNPGRPARVHIRTLSQASQDARGSRERCGALQTRRRRHEKPGGPEEPEPGTRPRLPHGEVLESDRQGNAPPAQEIYGPRLGYHDRHTLVNRELIDNVASRGHRTAFARYERARPRKLSDREPPVIASARRHRVCLRSISAPAPPPGSHRSQVNQRVIGDQHDSQMHAHQHRHRLGGLALLQNVEVGKEQDQRHHDGQSEEEPPWSGRDAGDDGPGDAGDDDADDGELGIVTESKWT